jgi:hypothetical protein
MSTEACPDFGTSSETPIEWASFFANALVKALYKMIGISGSKFLIVCASRTSTPSSCVKSFLRARLTNALSSTINTVFGI